MIDWSTFILSLAGTLVGGGGLTALVLIPQTRKSKILDNEAKQSEEWKKLYEEERQSFLTLRKEKDAEIKERDAKIDSLYGEISRHRDEKAVLAKKNAELEVCNIKLTFLKCVVPSCMKRDPQTGY